MDNTKIDVNGGKINLYGSSATIKKEKNIIENLNLTGNEYEDRLIIQKCIDEQKLKSSILYNGNQIYPFEKIIKSYRKLQKSGTLDNLSMEMYHFFMYACGDIAHYDIGGYKYYYNNSFIKLENDLLKDSIVSSRYSDIDRIFKELKIGTRYFEERKNINVDELTISELKSIIKECGWDVSIDNKSWKIERNNYYFKVDISSNTVSKIIGQIHEYYNNFDKNEYAENIIANRKEQSDMLTIKDIVTLSQNVEVSLSELAFNVVYKTRIAVDENKTINKLEKNNDDFDYEY